MKRLNVVELKNTLGEVLNRAEYQGERVIIHRRGKDAAALIPIEDLRLFERLLDEAEDRIDADAVREALAEPGERLPYSEARSRLGLSDEPGRKTRAVRDRVDQGRRAGARRTTEEGPGPRRRQDPGARR